MPPIETRGRKQVATYWRFAGYDDYGTILVDDPEEVYVRWEEDYREELDPDGTRISVLGDVVVNFDLNVNDLMYLGSIDQFENEVLGLSSGGGDYLGLSQGGALLITAAGTGHVGPDVLQVRRFSKIPDVKGRRFRRTAAMVKFANTLPTLV